MGGPPPALRGDVCHFIPPSSALPARPAQDHVRLAGQYLVIQIPFTAKLETGLISATTTLPSRFGAAAPPITLPVLLIPPETSSSGFDRGSGRGLRCQLLEAQAVPRHGC